MTKQNQLTRTCSVCGLQKPLSAFLQLSATQGTIYGNICSTCRSTENKEKQNLILREEERSSTTSGSRIGSKQKVEIVKEKRRQAQEVKEFYTKREEKNEKLTTEKNEQVDKIEKAERDHREVFIDAKKKQSYLNYQTKSSPLSISFPGQKNEPAQTSSQPSAEKTQAAEAFNQEEAIKQEQAKTTINLSGSQLLDPQHNTISRDNPIFNSYQAFIGGDAKIGSSLHKQRQQKIDAEKKQTQEKNAAVEYIEKTWGPSSRKR